MDNLIIRLFLDEDFDALNNTVRWNGKARIKDETVAHHSYIVATFCRVILEDIFPNKQVNYISQLSAQSTKLKILTKALFHDFDESVTGDINHIVKYNTFNGKDIITALNLYSEYMMNEKLDLELASDKMLYDSITDKDIFEKKLVKLCDWLSLLFYASKEISLGNKRFIKSWHYGVIQCNAVCQELMSYEDKAKSEYSLDMNFEVIKTLHEYDFSKILNNYGQI